MVNCNTHARTPPNRHTDARAMNVDVRTGAFSSHNGRAVLDCLARKQPRSISEETWHNFVRELGATTHPDECFRRLLGAGPFHFGDTSQEYESMERIRETLLADRSRPRRAPERETRSSSARRRTLSVVDALSAISEASSVGSHFSDRSFMRRIDENRRVYANSRAQLPR